MFSDRAIRAAAEQFRLALPVPPDGATAAAAPVLEVLLDASLSMTSGDGSKEQLARELAILLMRFCAAAGVRGSVAVLRGARSRTMDIAEADRIAQVPFDGAMALPDLVSAVGPASGASRVFLSDFLDPGEPGLWLARAAAGVVRLWLIQVLDPWELQPEPSGPLLLRDVETDETLPVSVDAETIAAYRARLDAHQTQLEAACQAVGGMLLTVPASPDLVSVCSERLVPAGLVGRASGEKP